MTKVTYSLMIHGGALIIDDGADRLTSLKRILQEGERLLKDGASSVDVVVHCVSLLEDDPLFNAGRGSVLNHEGRVDLDASIMRGSDMMAGAIAGVEGVKNPIKLARVVMEESDHVLLIGQGAENFARLHNIEHAEQGYFKTTHRIKQWENAKSADKVVLDHSDFPTTEKKLGTVGAVARDVYGDLAAATSTGGIVNKKFGRVGDTPIIGSGTYAENGVCAVSTSGFGEQLIRTVLAKHVADIIRYKRVDALAAAELGMQYFLQAVRGLGGMIVIDATGMCAKAHSASGIFYGYVTETYDIYVGKQ